MHLPCGEEAVSNRAWEDLYTASRSYDWPFSAVRKLYAYLVPLLASRKENLSLSFSCVNTWDHAKLD